MKLTDLTRGEISRAGAKAANLGELAGAGFPVPNGFVVTTDAFNRFLTVNNLTFTSLYSGTTWEYPCYYGPWNSSKQTPLVALLGNKLIEHTSQVWSIANALTRRPPCCISLRRSSGL